MRSRVRDDDDNERDGRIVRSWKFNPSLIRTFRQQEAVLKDNDWSHLDGRQISRKDPRRVAARAFFVATAFIVDGLKALRGTS